MLGRRVQRPWPSSRTPVAFYYAENMFWADWDNARVRLVCSAVASSDAAYFRTDSYNACGCKTHSAVGYPKCMHTHVTSSKILFSLPTCNSTYLHASKTLSYTSHTNLFPSIEHFHTLCKDKLLARFSLFFLLPFAYPFN